MITWVWGVDIAISHQSIGFACMDDHTVEVRSLHIPTDRTEGDRLSFIRGQVFGWARVLAGRFPPAAIFIEQPSGKFVEQGLIGVAHVVQEAINTATGARADDGQVEGATWMIPSSRWKTAIGLAGNATKPQIRARVELYHPGLCDSQDEADAVGIAKAGRKILRSRRWDIAA